MTESSDSTTVKKTSPPSNSRQPKAKTACKTAILIVGMHRSGTSMTTRVLNILGCDTAVSLLEGDQFNQRGYWESPEIANLNDEILSSAGLTWYDWCGVSADWYASPKKPVFEAKAMELLKNLFSDSHFFIMKDPRFCLLLPFWLEVLKKSGVAPRIVLPWRDPVEVAASLLRRNGMNPSIAQVIWLRHVLEAERASRSLPRAFLRYGDLTTDWHSTAGRIADEIGVRWPRTSTASQIEVDAFLSTDLQHHDAKSKKSLNGASPIKASWLEETVAILGTGAATEDEHERLDAIHLEFSRAAELFGRPVAEITQHGRRLWADLQRIEETLAQSQEKTGQREKELSELTAEAEAAQQALGQREKALAAMQTLFSEASHSMRRTNDELEVVLDELEACRSRETALRSEIEAAQQALRESREVSGRREKELRKAQRGLQSIEASRIWRSTAPYRRFRRWIRNRQ